MPPRGTASVAALRQYVRYADAKGIDTAHLFSRAGLEPSILHSDDGRLKGEQLQDFIRLLAETTGNPVLGLETGDYVQPGSYSVLGYITMSCATLAEVVTRIAPYEKLVGDMGTTGLRMNGDELSLVWTCNYTDPAVWPQVVDNVFASWINYARWLADNRKASPLRVQLRRSSPGSDYEKAYAERWQCPVEFSAEEDCVILRQSLLSTRLRQPDPLLRKTLETHALSQLALLDSDTDLTSRVKQSIQKQLADGVTRQDMIAEDLGMTSRVKQSIQKQLADGVTRQDMIAEDLGMTSRTLQRKLGQEGVSYQKLLDEVRQQMAEDYLRNTEMSIPDIAFRLGYSETTSFHRKFKAVMGQTPGDFRKN